MAYVAISEVLKEQVANNIDAMRNSETKATFGENIYAFPQLQLQHDDPLFNHFWAKAPHLRGQIPIEWLGAVARVDLHVIADEARVQERYELADTMYIPHRHAGYAPGINVPETDERFAAVRERVKQVSEVNKRWKNIKEQVIGFLKECKSLNEAVKLYPDIVHYIPPHFLMKLNEQKVKAARDVSAAAAKLAEMDTTALSAAPVLARITGHK
jgi:hypothetical protein